MTTPNTTQNPPKAKLLIVEDDERIASLLVQFLRSENFAVSRVATGELAVERIREDSPDIVLLDLMLPKMDGVEVCTQVRAFYRKGILMLTAHEGEIQEITALNAGVDDFLTKPVRTHILLARLNALLRRQERPTAASLLTFGKLSIDSGRRLVSYADQTLPFTESEFELLWILASQAGNIVKRDNLFHALCDKDYDGLDRSIDMRVSKLRKKLTEYCGNHEYIRTLRQLGYLFVGE